MPTSTQIIGKTSAINGGLFRIKQRLSLLGVEVKNPSTNAIVEVNGKKYVYNPLEWSEYEATLDMAENVRANDLHIVSNDVGGLIGKQAALSIVWAMVHGKPIIITHKPYFRSNSDPIIVGLIIRNQKRFTYQPLLKLNNDELLPFIEQVAAKKPAYKLTKLEKTWVKRHVRDLLREVLKAPKVPY